MIPAQRGRIIDHPGQVPMISVLANLLRLR